MGAFTSKGQPNNALKTLWKRQGIPIDGPTTYHYEPVMNP